MLGKITHNFCNGSNFCIFFTYKYNMKKKCYIKKEKNSKKDVTFQPLRVL